MPQPIQIISAGDIQLMEQVHTQTELMGRLASDSSRALLSPSISPILRSQNSTSNTKTIKSISQAQTTSENNTMPSASRAKIATGSSDLSSTMRSATSISGTSGPMSNTRPARSIAQAQVSSPNNIMPSTSRDAIAIGSSDPFASTRSITSIADINIAISNRAPSRSTAQPRLTALNDIMPATSRFAIATGSLNPSSFLDSATPVVSFARQPKPIHKAWNAVFVRTAKCDICNKNKHAVIQRCVDCNHQLCTDCMMSKSWNPGHGADLDELRWIDTAELVKKTRKAKAAPTPSSTKNTQATTPSSEIVGNKRIAPEGSQASGSGYSKKARIESPGLVGKEQKTAYLSVGNNNNISLAISHQPLLGGSAANEATLRDVFIPSSVAGEPGRATIADSQQMSHKEPLPKKGGSLISLTNSNVSASTKLRVRRKALTTTQIKAVSNDSVRRQPPRRQNVVSYSEHQGEKDEEGNEEEDGKFIPYSREEKVMSYIEPAKSAYSAQGPDHAERAVKSFKASTKPNPGLSLKHDPKDKEPLNIRKDKSEAPSNNLSPGYTQSALASGSGFLKGSTGGSYVSGGDIEGYKHLGEFSTGPQQHATPHFNQTAKILGLNNPVLQTPTAEPAGSRGNVQHGESSPFDFAGALAKVMKDKAEKKKEEEGKKLAAFNLECAKNWDNEKTFAILRQQGKADEARELFQTAKTMLAMAHGITLDPNEN